MRAASIDCMRRVTDVSGVKHYAHVHASVLPSCMLTTAYHLLDSVYMTWLSSVTKEDLSQYTYTLVV